MKRRLSWALWFLSIAGCATASSTAQRCPCSTGPGAERVPSHETGVGFVVVTPDRGFMGNTEVEDAFSVLQKEHNSAFAVVTDQRTSSDLATALRKVADRGARRAVVLPFFLSSEAKFLLLQRLVTEERWPIPITLARPFGQSYLAIEVLADRLQAIREPKGRRVVIVGHGAEPSSVALQEAELQRMANQASEGFGFESVQVLSWPELDKEDGQDDHVKAALSERLKGAPRPVVVPFHLGWKLDSMMSFTALLTEQVKGLAEIVDVDVTPHSAVGTWMLREARRQLALRDEDVGVVLLAHGSDYEWNETMWSSVAPLASRFKIEPAFCMADPPLVERAVRRLEARGARAIVIVRVFGLARSFERDIERMIGWDVEGRAPSGQGVHEGHRGPPRPGYQTAGGHGNGRHGRAGPVPRIRASVPMVTVGGLEDAPYFADALLDRALSLSKDPARETVILVAHGAGPDAVNDHWRDVLASIAQRIRSGRGAQFRAVKVGTWREDWPVKREPEVAAIRRMVEEATRDGGRAIVIPARTTGVGPEKRFLAGLPVEIGTGFAPHPLFERWFEEQVRLGILRLSGAAAR
ncbi:MAG: cobalamin biosynthesis protein CbiX [Deltaproteobacteria bacterium]|nr:cobalamin biosynthesis protein CbiX [Deltaproteobacteria bacterium]